MKLLLIGMVFTILTVEGIKPPSSFFCRSANGVCKDIRGGAGWFGKSDDKNDTRDDKQDEKNEQQNPQQTYYPPPPPFPPPPPPHEDENIASQQYIPPPPPPPMSQGKSEENDFVAQDVQDMKDSIDPIMYPPYDYYNDPNPPQMNPSDSYYNPPPQQYHPQDQWQEYQDQQHEYISLTEKIQNLTQEIQNYNNESSVHLQEIDSLTEQVANLSNQLAHEQVQLKEVEHNSTVYYDRWKDCESSKKELEDILEEMKEQKEKWEKLEEVMELEIDEKKTQIEELSFFVEQVRESSEHESVKRNSLSKTSASIPITTKKNGFFTSLFNILLMRSSSSNTAPLLDDPNAQKLNLTRTTLTMALTQTRQHVSELESVIDTLSQNNTAIAEVVESRDTLISELHSRVQVFEEDKLVLKAALKQLQREMKEEIGPAREKLENELREKSEGTLGLLFYLSKSDFYHLFVLNHSLILV